MHVDVRRGMLLGLAGLVAVVLLWLVASLLDPSVDASGARGDFGRGGDDGVTSPVPTVLQERQGSTGGGAG